MKIKFLGAAGGVTGSKTLLTIEDEQYLVDYGLFQGGSKVREQNWIDHDFSEVNAVILTHAHIDHSGLLPRLKRCGFRGKIYCTRDTFKLCSILLADSAHLHEEDAKYANKTHYSRHKPALPLYTSEDVEEVMEHFHVVEFDSAIQISPRLSLKFHWAGHILGSSFVECKMKNDEGVEKTAVFSGDIGHTRSSVFLPPERLCGHDYLILESTYGNKLHARTPAIDVLEIYLNIILKRGGTAILPSFSVGRTQEVLFLINKLIESGKVPAVPVILDSPLSRKANKIFLETYADEFLSAEMIKSFATGPFPKTLREIDTVEESKAVHNLEGPMIIVSASGMMDGGRVVHHVKKRITDPRNGIIFVGFQPEGTKGRLLLDGIDTLRLHKQEFPVNASIFNINALSAHGDFLDIMEWLGQACNKPEFIILNHGEPPASKNLKLMIESQLAISTTIALMDEEFNLLTMYTHDNK